MYNVIFEPRAEKKFLKLESAVQKQILKYMRNDILLRSPKSFGRPLMYERSGEWRYRVGDYRIICKILDHELVILVIDIDHRKDVYRRE